MARHLEVTRKEEEEAKRRTQRIVGGKKTKNEKTKNESGRELGDNGGKAEVCLVRGEKTTFAGGINDHPEKDRSVVK